MSRAGRRRQKEFNHKSSSFCSPLYFSSYQNFAWVINSVCTIMKEELASGSFQRRRELQWSNLCWTGSTTWRNGPLNSFWTSWIGLGKRASETFFGFLKVSTVISLWILISWSLSNSSFSRLPSSSSAELLQRNPKREPQLRDLFVFEIQNLDPNFEVNVIGGVARQRSRPRLCVP